MAWVQYSKTPEAEWLYSIFCGNFCGGFFPYWENVTYSVLSNFAMSWFGQLEHSTVTHESFSRLKQKQDGSGISSL